MPVETVYIEENKTSHFNPIKDSVRIYLVFGKFLFSSLSSSVLDLLLFQFRGGKVDDHTRESDFGCI